MKYAINCVLLYEPYTQRKKPKPWNFKINSVQSNWPIISGLTKALNNTAWIWWSEGKKERSRWEAWSWGVRGYWIYGFPTGTRGHVMNSQVNTADKRLRWFPPDCDPRITITQSASHSHFIWDLTKVKLLINWTICLIWVFMNIYCIPCQFSDFYFSLSMQDH